MRLLKAVSALRGLVDRRITEHPAENADRLLSTSSFILHQHRRAHNRALGALTEARFTSRKSRWRSQTSLQGYARPPAPCPTTLPRSPPTQLGPPATSAGHTKSPAAGTRTGGTDSAPLVPANARATGQPFTARGPAPPARKRRGAPPPARRSREFPCRGRPAGKARPVAARAPREAACSARAACARFPGGIRAWRSRETRGHPCRGPRQARGYG